MKLLLDEMYAPAVAALLRDWGHDAIAVTERADLVGMPDEDLVRIATSDDRAVVTENIRDFAGLNLRFSVRGQPHSGLIFALSRRFPRSAQNYVQVLADALASFLSEHGAMLNGVESFVWWLQRPDR